MEFRAPTAAAQLNANAMDYLTKNLTDPQAGRRALNRIVSELGNATSSYPDWHPLLTAPDSAGRDHVTSLSQLEVYTGIDHTVTFVKGFITCPYSETIADQMVGAVHKVTGLSAYRLAEPLYSDSAYPVVVAADDVFLEADGTIRSRDALAWFTQLLVKDARTAQVGETWWNIHSSALGRPNGSRSSLFVNQYTGSHMRKIHDAMNNSGMFGPIKEHSLDMLSQKKRDRICETLIRAAVTNWDQQATNFTFELCGEVCKAAVRDTWNDGCELSVRVKIGEDDLNISGFYYASQDKVDHQDPTGKRQLAEKFI